tara:strand:+ start:345 stop:707 length:363 start_codon:yes stop_codon:yes gene_type:complete
MRRLPGMSREEFQDYWQNKHPMAAASNASETLGIKKYVQVLTLSDETHISFQAIRNSEKEFDGVAEIWIDDIETFNKKWKSGRGWETFKAFLEDEKNFVDWEKSVFFIAEEKVLVREKII